MIHEVPQLLYFNKNVEKHCSAINAKQHNKQMSSTTYNDETSVINTC